MTGGRPAQGDPDRRELSRCLRAVARQGAGAGRCVRTLREAAEQDPAGAAVAAVGIDPRERIDRRLEWFRRTCGLCPRTAVTASGRREQVLISLEELWRFYLPLCQALVGRARGRDSVRVLAGVAGPPGSGKSVFCVLMMKIINTCVKDGGLRAAMCSMDGFHYPNGYLEAHWTEEGGRRVPLRSRKGAAETFDVEAFVAHLDRLASQPTVSMPRYDRGLHEPVADAVRIGRRHRVVMVEGNYLLLREGAWSAVAPRLDVRLFLEIPLEAVRERIIRRHVRGGRSRQDAERHFERVDRPNFQLCLAGADGAQLIVERNADQHVAGLRAVSGQDG